MKNIEEQQLKKQYKPKQW